MELGIKEGFSIENREDWNDFGKDDEEKDLEFCWKHLGDSPPLIVYSGVGVIVWLCIEVVEGISLFKGEVLR